MLSNEIKIFRDEFNLKQIDLANIMEVDQSTIARWENGTRKISKGNLSKLIDIVYSFKGKIIPTKDEALLLKEREAVITKVNSYLAICIEYKNIRDKKKIMKICLSILDEVA